MRLLDCLEDADVGDTAGAAAAQRQAHPRARVARRARAAAVWLRGVRQGGLGGEQEKEDPVAFAWTRAGMACQPDPLVVWSTDDPDERPFSDA